MPRLRASRRSRLLGVVAGASCGALVACAPAGAAAGPPLRERPADLAAALSCSPNLATATKPAVILLHGTTASPEDSFSWGYAKVLPELGYPACTVRLPRRATVDLQRTAEYVVYAIRTVAARTHRRVDVLGHSQGGFLDVFAAKFWPDVPGLVDDVISLSAPFKEAEGTQLGCNALSCSPPFRQRQKGARFFGAFLARPVPPGPSFTSMLSLVDEVTRPQPASSTLTGPPGTDVRTITLQDLCPGRTTDHIGMIADAVVFQLVLDAFTHAGTANPARITPDCAANHFPGLDEAGFAAALPSAVANLVVAGVTAEQSPAEPPVRCYLDPACASAAERGTVVASAARRGRRLALRVQAPGEVRITVRRGGRRLGRAVVRSLSVGRRTVVLPSGGRARDRIAIEGRPRGYTRYVTELTLTA